MKKTYILILLFLSFSCASLPSYEIIPTKKYKGKPKKIVSSYYTITKEKEIFKMKTILYFNKKEQIIKILGYGSDKKRGNLNSKYFYDKKNNKIQTLIVNKYDEINVTINYLYNKKNKLIKEEYINNKEVFIKLYEYNRKKKTIDIMSEKNGKSIITYDKNMREIEIISIDSSSNITFRKKSEYSKNSILTESVYNNSGSKPTRISQKLFNKYNNLIMYRSINIKKGDTIFSKPNITKYKYDQKKNIIEKIFIKNSIKNSIIRNEFTYY